MANGFEDKLAEIADRSFVAIKPRLVNVVDPFWQEKLGVVVRIPGGCELLVDTPELQRLKSLVDDGRLESGVLMSGVPLVISDPYFPKMEVSVPMLELVTDFNPIQTGTGPRNRIPIVRCLHRVEKPHPGCMYCLYRTWKPMLAQKEGATK